MTESFLSPHRKTMTSELFSEKAMDVILKGFKLIDEKGQDCLLYTSDAADE